MTECKKSLLDSLPQNIKIEALNEAMEAFWQVDIATTLTLGNLKRMEAASEVLEKYYRMALQQNQLEET